MPLHEATANNAILESMACGLPLVVSDIGGIGDYVSPDCGILVRPHDARNMAEAVLDLLSAPSERQRMAEQARAQALRFAWPQIIDQLRSVYTAIS
jgi:glycosyltransferase involved in cell wall biosynthesis